MQKFTIVLLSTIVFILLAIFFHLDFQTALCWVIMAILMVSPLYVYPSILKNPFDPLLFTFVKSLFIPFVIGGLLMFLYPVYSYNQSAFALTLLYTGIGYLFIVVGFAHQAKLKPTSALWVYKTSESRINSYLIGAIFLYILSVIARLYILFLGITHASNDITSAGIKENTTLFSFLEIFFSIADYSFISIFYILVKYRRKWLLFMVPLFATQIGLALVNGGRAGMILAFVYVLLIYNFYVKQISLRRIVFFCLLILLVLVPFTTSFRNNYQRSLLTSDNEVGYDAVLSSLATGQKTTNSEKIESFQRYYSPLEGFTRVVEMVPSVTDYKLGQTFFPGIFSQFIPRFLWKNKPIVLPGREFAKTFWKKNVDEFFGTNEEISIFGELYYNFWIIGILGLYVVGRLIAYIYFDFLRYKDYEEFFIIRYVFLFNNLSLLLAGGIQTNFAQLFKEWLVMNVFLVLLTRALPKKVYPRKKSVVSVGLVKAA